MDYNPAFIFDFFVIIRVDAVEDVLDLALARSMDYRSLTSTVHINSNYFVGENLRREIHSTDEIERATAHAGEIFKKDVFPVLEACREISDVERLLNEKINSIQVSMCRTTRMPV